MLKNVLDSLVTLEAKWVTVQTLSLEEFLVEYDKNNVADLSNIIVGHYEYGYFLQLGEGLNIAFACDIDVPPVGTKINKRKVFILVLEDQSSFAKATGRKLPNIFRAILKRKNNTEV